MSETITFEYISTDTLTTSSSTLKADDLAPKNVVKPTTGSIWKVSYSLTDVMQKTSRINALYSIFMSSSQSSTYNSETFTQLRIDFCLQPETYPSIYCPTITDYNNLNTNTCSRLYSINSDFNNSKISNKIQCSDLTQYLDVSNNNSTMKSAVQNGYKTFCTNNKTMRECQCYNRSSFTAYQNAKSILSSGSTMQSGNECCWYLPCQFQTNITVDADIQNAYDKIQCPDVCQNIIAAVNVKNVVMSDISLSNDCVGTNSSNVQKDISDSVSKSDTTQLFAEQEKKKSVAATTPSNTFTLNRKSFIIIIAVVVVFVVILFIILAVKE